MYLSDTPQACKEKGRLFMTHTLVRFIFIAALALLAASVIVIVATLWKTRSSASHTTNTAAQLPLFHTWEDATEPLPDSALFDNLFDQQQLLEQQRLQQELLERDMLEQQRLLQEQMQQDLLQQQMQQDMMMQQGFGGGFGF